MSLDKTIALICFMALSGCTAKKIEPPQVIAIPTTSASMFQQAAQLPELEDFFYLDEKQKKDFLTHFNSQAQSTYTAEHRLYNYLQNKLVYFTYEGANNTAQVALQQLSGNCMTLALLTTALAKLVNIDVGYQVMYQEPMFDYKDNIFISSNHIRTYLYKNNDAPKKGEFVLQRAALIIDYFPDSGDVTGENISPSRFYAQLYNNLAADALLQGDHDKAFFLSQKALQKDASYTPAVNMIALMYYRKKAYPEASQWFDYGMKQDNNQITLLSNYRDLAKKTNNQQLLKRINQRLLGYNDDNPYAWLALAIDAERNQQFSDAADYYKKLLDKAPYLHNANLALLRLYLKQQNYSSAQKIVEQAMQYAYEPARLEFYQMKLTALKQHRKKLEKMD